MPFILLFLTALISTSGFSVTGDRFIRNLNEDRDLSICVNDGGAKLTCPIVITGSTGSVKLGSFTMVDSTNVLGFQQTIDTTNGTVFMNTSNHQMAFGINNLRRTLIDVDGNLSHEASNTNSVSDFGHAPLMITGADTWTPSISTGTSGSADATVIVGPEDGTTSDNASLVFDIGSSSIGYRLEAEGASPFDFVISRYNSGWIESLRIDQGDGEINLRIEENGTTSTSNQGCSSDLNDANLCHGSYTPTVVGLDSGNCKIDTTNPVYWYRIGPSVTVWGHGEISSSGDCQGGTSAQAWTLSVPITDGGNFTTDNQVSGHWDCFNSASSALIYGSIFRNPSSDDAKFQIEGNSICGTGRNVYFRFSYIIP